MPTYHIYLMYSMLKISRTTVYINTKGVFHCQKKTVVHKFLTTCYWFPNGVLLTLKLACIKVPRMHKAQLSCVCGALPNCLSYRKQRIPNSIQNIWQLKPFVAELVVAKSLTKGCTTKKGIADLPVLWRPCSYHKWNWSYAFSIKKIRGTWKCPAFALELTHQLLPRTKFY